MARRLEAQEASLIGEALLALGRGELEKAVEGLERVHEEDPTQLNDLPVEPLYDPLRHLPRFRNLESGVSLNR